MKMFLSRGTLVGLVGAFAVVTCSLSARAVEFCGLLTDAASEERVLDRFHILKEFDGRAFMDMETCLVWDLQVVTEPQTLNDAMAHCATLGQGGPYGRMGWELPTMAELTSVDGEQWEKQRVTFEEYKLPPAVRMEKDFWTTTPWPTDQNAWAVVQFSARTTIVYPLDQSMKAGVWCVRGAAAKGLR